MTQQKVNEMSNDDDLFGLIGDLGAAVNAAKDPALDPQLQALARQAAERAAAELARHKPDNPQ
ncbi:hypothetical protein ABZX33_34910 [Streptomyces sp. NPDC004608]|uniref:hypothetical protein n=2 Tax=unclassified Streptomyces TaxID=2593676 RepID=UPI0033A9A707